MRAAAEATVLSVGLCLPAVLGWGGDTTRNVDYQRRFRQTDAGNNQTHKCHRQKQPSNGLAGAEHCPIILQRAHREREIRLLAGLRSRVNRFGSWVSASWCLFGVHFWRAPSRLFTCGPAWCGSSLGISPRLQRACPRPIWSRLDRVVCCYPDCETPLREAASKARETPAFTYPRDRWYVRAMIKLENVLRRLRGNPFRAFVHSPERMTEVLKTTGLVRVALRRTLVWALEVYRRES